MTSVTVVAVTVLSVLLVDSGHTITINSEKKVTANGNDRDTQSFTFSSNGKDQLIFSDSTFPDGSGGSRRESNPNRRAGVATNSNEFFESGWRPVYSFSLDQAQEKISDQLPLEAVHIPAVIAEPPKNRTEKFFRFSESDIMKKPVVDQANMISEAPSKSVKFEDDYYEDEPYEDESSHEGEINMPANLPEITPRMLKFEESDRMKFEEDSPKVLKFGDKVTNSQTHTGDRKQSDSYEVYVIENLMKNTTGFLRFGNSDNGPIQNDTFEDTQPRILKLDSEVSANQERPSNLLRNASRFFRFEDSDRQPERIRVEKSPISTIKFHENVSPREDFRFPGNDEVSRNDESHRNQGGSFKFRETESRPQPSSQMRFDESESNPLKFTNDAPSRLQTGDNQFYTVKATIQIGDSNNAAITPPNPPMPVPTRRPKKKKGKIYNQYAIDIRKQDDGFNYQQPTDYDNYLTDSQQSHSSQADQYQTNQYPVKQYPGGQYPANYQIPPTPQNSANDPYYQNPGSPGTPYPPFDPNTYYIQNYLNNYQYPPYNPNQQFPAEVSSPYPSLYPQQAQNLPTNLIPGAAQSDNPLNAQNILGVLQNIFNVTPGTFTTSPTSNGGHGASQAGTSPYSGVQGASSPVTAVSSQLRKALDNIAENDELQCVPKLVCMMSRRSSGQGFSTYVNRGLLSTVLSAVPDSSPWLKFSRAALLGYGIGANSCDVYYPKCPKDESEIIYYMNNHRGGFFRFFNDAQNNVNSG